ncbi:hypothetical protein BT67DRAFT_30637 [Trichocladium antarcticum]|uniref:WW domain-containing protein n=1 Tax=Trichocladium antarcticum TaxID=1450529 RepID=A0AAN6UTL5_9PEZI|nr:hypothetical protein BT67DRAFT_30637 [Trichocladium antarcticum]
MDTPSEPPPSYEQATGPDTLPPHPRNGIPLHARRSMEDELRPLPPGWVREFDPETQHQFFVDTMSSPPRSIWHHPYDDEVYLNSLPPSERGTIRKTHSGLDSSRQRPSQADMTAESTDGESDTDRGHGDKDHRSLGRKLKDRITGTTHEERAAERARRAAAEHEMYRQHRILRRAMLEAMRTGRPQLMGRDENRTKVYLEPPGHTFPGVTGVRRVSPYMSEVVYDGADGRRAWPSGRYLRPEGEMYGNAYGGYGCGKFGGGRWDRPTDRYGRPVGRGFGGGLGFPLMAPLLGGMMLGGLTGAVI